MKHPYKMVRMSLEKKIVLWIDLVEFFSVSLLTKKYVSSPIIYGVIKNLHDVLLLFFTFHY